ncbi:hypothetical protein ACFSQD_16885 [Flavihumibacter stibioxidans]|uniref:Lipoprotein n=1 Tax=Flavihumibacter stibioxidans TaxID=1834163 RepID=A0ABR7M6Y1_9BACT|nr:hypothetical protein [Flavihumibacter stibioxidans]MBC6490712.1 hypothetical protein [Flavihumibacter stibioxidans]
MKKNFRILSCLTLIFLIQTSCNNNATKDNSHANNGSNIKLTEKPVGESGYVISVPIDYSITTSNGPDFSVYYFSPTDTTVKGKLSGGLYFGNFPHEFDADNDSCKTETLMGKILNTLQEWMVFNCQEEYSIQTIADNKKGEGWNQRIHAFGHSKSRDELQTILDIYSTLRKK